MSQTRPSLAATAHRAIRTRARLAQALVRRRNALTRSVARFLVFFVLLDPVRPSAIRTVASEHLRARLGLVRRAEDTQRGLERVPRKRRALAIPRARSDLLQSHGAGMRGVHARFARGRRAGVPPDTIRHQRVVELGIKVVELVVHVLRLLSHLGQTGLSHHRAPANLDSRRASVR